MGSRNAECNRRLRAAAADRGDCITCKCRPAKQGRRTCQHCLDIRKARAERWIARGLCSRCGDAPLSSATLCAGCSAAMVATMKVRRAAKVAAGLCSRDGCGAQLHSASMCFGHVIEMRRASRARAAARAA